MDCPEATVFHSVLITFINDYAIAFRQKNAKELNSLQLWANDIENKTFKLCSISMDVTPEQLREFLHNTFRKIEQGDLYSIKKTRNYYIKYEKRSKKEISLYGSRKTTSEVIRY